MKRLTITLAALAACTLAAGSVAAKGKGNNGGGGNSGGNRNSGGAIRSQITTSNNLPKFQKFDKPVMTPKFDKHVTTPKFEQKVQHTQKVQLNHVVKNKSFTIAHCPTKSWTKCDFGYCFKGKSCFHWEHKCWYPSYGCYFYYCPYTCVEYWFCVEDDCYYPVGYCPVAYRVKYRFGW